MMQPCAETTKRPGTHDVFTAVPKSDTEQRAWDRSWNGGQSFIFLVCLFVCLFFFDLYLYYNILYMSFSLSDIASRCL